MISTLIKLVRRAEALALVALCTAFIIGLDLSLSWRMEHDTPLLHYAAFLILDHGMVPYRDIFETSFVGSFLFHMLILSTLGQGDEAFRFMDLIWFSGTGLGLWLAMKPFGARAGLASIALFGIIYFSQGPTMSLQRDYVGILPILFALWLTWSEHPFQSRNWRSVLVGVLFGLSISIKPHLGLGLPLMLIYMALDSQGTRSARLLLLIQSGFWAALGVMLVLLPMFFWLWRIGALPAFYEIFTQYIPLHLDLSRTHKLLSEDERLAYLWENWLVLGLYTALLPATGFGLLRGWLIQRKTPLQKTRQHRLILLLVLLLAYSIYPAISGQFWDYHWMPFAAFLSMALALNFSPWTTSTTLSTSRPDNLPATTPRPAVFLVLSMLGVTFLFIGLVNTIDLRYRFDQQIQGKPPPPPKSGRVDEIYWVISRKIQPGDKIQPLDWTGGAIHSMLMLKAPLATSFLYDYHFYHHVDLPYIQGLRRRFIHELTQSKPRFIIDIEDAERPYGPRTSNSFPELADYIEQNYQTFYTGLRFQILERRPNGQDRTQPPTDRQWESE